MHWVVVSSIPSADALVMIRGRPFSGQLGNMSLNESLSIVTSDLNQAINALDSGNSSGAIDSLEHANDTLSEFYL